MRRIRKMAHTLGAAMMLATVSASAAVDQFQGMAVDVIGQGRQVLMVPGLNSGMESWRDTCKALQDVPVQCHLVQLPGFAGQPAQEEEGFVQPVRERLQAYISQRMGPRPVLAGHSLGGFLSLQLAADGGDSIGGVIVVDSLPFFPVAGNPAATADSMRPMAEAMRTQMQALDEENYRRQALASLAGMSKSAERQALLRKWSADSDRATTTQAMYELMTTDIRPQLPKVSAPVVVFGAWEAYARFGATKESTGAIFESQYAGLPNGRVAMADTGYHFLMWDAASWLEGEIRRFLADHP